MHTNIAIQLSEHAFSSLVDEASAVGKTPAELAAAVVEKTYSQPHAESPDANSARSQFERCFGSVDLGRPIGLSNESIDADLANEFESSPESA